MSAYLTPDHADAYVDHPSPQERLDAWREYHPRNPSPLLCAACKGYGGHNLKVNANPLPKNMPDTVENRHLYCHFRAGCLQCSGWGYVLDARDASCAHEWDSGARVANCLTNYTCVKPGCGRVIQVDSSD